LLSYTMFSTLDHLKIKGSKNYIIEQFVETQLFISTI